ncbi:MAG: proton-conducting transporter membrane subunit, partial [Gammaproteobacteria bacterium]|nr:proton-conducting transporter membrane subunit [Gammaproteobacteria bacterium]
MGTHRAVVGAHHPGEWARHVCRGPPLPGGPGDFRPAADDRCDRPLPCHRLAGVRPAGPGNRRRLADIFGFGIKAAFPFLHNWLQDAYPAASPSGTVVLSAFTTKLAIYALARGYAGTEILIPIGALMTAFPIFYAVIENDLRRVLAYSLNNQLGFMVVG